MLNSILTSELTLPAFLICTLVSLLLGTASAAVYKRKNQCSESFAMTLALMPALVQLVIMMVNGNIGAGVAVMGAFSLVRFRSAAGTAKEIGAIFLSMAIGLADGMGCIVLAMLFFVIITIFQLILDAVHFGESKTTERRLKITIPEDLDYDGLFDDIFAAYTTRAELERVKTTNMGTLYELRYHIRLKGDRVPKEFLDALRCRNGNLNIVCGRVNEKDAL